MSDDGLPKISPLYALITGDVEAPSNVFI